MGGVPIASVEYSYRMLIDGGERLVELDEAALIVDLGGLVDALNRCVNGLPTLSSGLDAMMRDV